ncbi:zinc-binding dehydrogenase [Spongisporangium articulatum]|uniref:Zinc-binding dehydrogenase n=1 Tax=Spongisporangium articulatum TaxID=3362603 RepID=A0ABW8AKQ2_9ACTN
MRALVIDAFGAVPAVRDLPDPTAPPGGVVVRVGATGLCRSDHHAIAGHDSDVTLPHVPGHEFAGTVEAVGEGVDVPLGARVTAPFVQACGRCAQCLAGDHQVCAHQVQPGFTTAGAFAEYVVVVNAAVNLVRLPDAVTDEAAALLGCRVGTAFRAVTAVGRLRAGEWVAVHGCGGVGLAAVEIAAAAGARVVAVDLNPAALDLAKELGAEAALDATGLEPDGAGHVVRDLTRGGAHLSLDALGSPATCTASVTGLRPRGRHVQVGLLLDGPTPVPMDLVVARELEVLGSHGMAAHSYPELLALVATGRLRPERAVTARVGLAEAGVRLHGMGDGSPTGVTVAHPGRP